MSTRAPLGFSVLTMVSVIAGCDPLEPLVQPGAIIVGVVCDSLTGRPRRNVEVSCRAGESRVDVETDTDGFFRCEGVSTVEGEALVRVDEGGDRRGRRYDVRVQPGEQSEIVDTACREGPSAPGLGDVDGRVCNRHTGELITEADVSLLLTVEGEEQVRTQQSSGAPDPGRFFFPDVPTGQWPLVIEAAGFHRSLAVTVLEGEVAEVDLGLCTKDEIGEGEGEGEGEWGPTGSAQGHVCMFDGTGLGGATITTTLPDGSTRTVTSDENGDWQMDDLPPGSYTFLIQAGSFTATRTATVVSNTVINLPEEDCELDQENVRIAVIEGAYDDVYSVLMNVGVDATIVDVFDGYYGPVDLLGSSSTLATYDAVLINCGADEYDYQSDPVLQDNLRAYVLAGGNVYASDLAYDFVEQIFPTFVEFFGDDATWGAAEIGMAGDVPGTITDSFLSTAIGTSNITLHYPYGSWAIVTGTASSTQVLIRGSAPYDDWNTGDYGVLEDNPHTLLYRPGGTSGGKVVFSSFHQEPGINVEQERILQLLMFQL